MASTIFAFVCFVAAYCFPRQASQLQIFITRHSGIPAPVSFQRLTEQADLFDKQLVRVYANLTQDRTGIYIFDERQGKNIEMIGADLLPNAQTSEINHWLQQLQNNEKTELPQVRHARAMITGWFNGYVTLGCFTPKHRLTIIKIEQPETINIGLSTTT